MENIGSLIDRPSVVSSLCDYINLFISILEQQEHDFKLMKIRGKLQYHSKAVELVWCPHMHSANARFIIWKWTVSVLARVQVYYSHE